MAPIGCHQSGSSDSHSRASEPRGAIGNAALVTREIVIHLDVIVSRLLHEHMRSSTEQFDIDIIGARGWEGT